jgi:hypothetical protein
MILKIVSSPWKVCQDSPNSAWHNGITIGSGNPKDARRICDLCELNSPEMNKLLGDMICAAPELYAALKLLHDNTAEYIRINHLGDPYQNADMRAARDVLAKVNLESDCDTFKG